MKVKTGCVLIDHLKKYSWGEVTKVTEIESAVGLCTDMGSLLKSWATAGRQTESAAGLSKNGRSTSLSIWWPAVTFLIKNSPLSKHNTTSLSVSWPVATYVITNAPCDRRNTSYYMVWIANPLCPVKDFVVIIRNEGLQGLQGHC